MTPDQKKQALRAELLVDPVVLAPGPDLTPIKPYYRSIIETAISNWNTANPDGPVAAYGGFTDKAIENDLAVVVPGLRPVRATSAEIRRPLMRGSWGRIQLVAAQTPPYETTPLTPQLALDPETQMNVTARNIISLLSDPAEMWFPEDFADLEATCATLLAAGHITQQEHDDVLAVMMGRDVTRAYEKGLVDEHMQIVTAAEISNALRGP